MILVHSRLKALHLLPKAIRIKPASFKSALRLLQKQRHRFISVLRCRGDEQLIGVWAEVGGW